MNDAAPVLEIRGLCVRFPTKRDVFGRPAAFLEAVRMVNLSMRRGECLGIVGESGSGKTTVANAIVGLADLSAGEILWEGRVLGPAGSRDRDLASAVQLVFQDPQASLDPRMRVRTIVAEGLMIQGALTSAERNARARELLGMVGLGADALDRYPHEFSGGQRQRIAIARALAVNPRLLVLDEPTSALDVSVQAQILNVLLDLQQRLDLTYVLITHDISVVGHLSHRIAVMRGGEIVEEGPTAAILSSPSHTYTKSLLAAVPRVGAKVDENEVVQ